jgi:hypothetical protein
MMPGLVNTKKEDLITSVLHFYSGEIPRNGKSTRTGSALLPMKKSALEGADLC